MLGHSENRDRRCRHEAIGQPMLIVITPQNDPPRHLTPTLKCELTMLTPHIWPRLPGLTRLLLAPRGGGGAWGNTQRGGGRWGVTATSGTG